MADEEWRDAVRDLNEVQRAQACGHYWRKGFCVYCGEGVDE